jgi:osmotically-inducible protein OsmY
MEKIRQIMMVLMLGLSLAVTVGCTSTPEKRGTEEYVDDKVLEARVKAALVKEEGLDASRIKVETYRGVVQLSGFVPDQKMAERAVAAARRVPGVREVKNDVRLTPKA